MCFCLSNVIWKDSLHYQYLTTTIKSSSSKMTFWKLKLKDKSGSLENYSQTSLPTNIGLWVLLKMGCHLLMGLLLSLVFPATLCNHSKLSWSPITTAQRLQPGTLQGTSQLGGVCTLAQDINVGSTQLLGSISGVGGWAPRKALKMQEPLSHHSSLQPYRVAWFVLKFLCLILTFYSLSENPIISNSCVSREDMNFV